MRHKILFAILFLAAFLRLYSLSTVPALNADEAAIGYNAYSLIKTGLDEHGNPWPIHFQSFNDYKPGLYFYIALPFIAVLGLTEFAVRAPGALLGVINVLAIWLLVRELFPKKNLSMGTVQLTLADLSAFLLAISPWHLHFSRGGWEVNTATTFITFGVFFLAKALKESKNWVIAGVFFALSAYTYHSARIVVPALLLGALIISKDRLKKQNWRVLLGSAIFVFLISTPMITDFLGPAGTSRASGVSIFADRGIIDRANEKRGQHSSLTSSFSKLVHNKPVEYTLAFSKNYIEHFWGEFLFLSGDEIQRNKVPEMGQLYLFQFPLISISLFAIIRKSKNWGIIFVWLAASPTAAALTFQSPHALRAQNMVIPITIISAYGLFVLLVWSQKKLKNLLLLKAFYVVLVTILAWSFGQYIHQYYVHMAKTYPFSSQYGVKELVGYTESIKEKFEGIYITDRYDQPYILFLFYSKYPPSSFQGEHELTGRDRYGFSTVSKFDRYTFASIKWDEIRDTRGVLIAGTPEEIPSEGVNIIKRIYFPNGHEAFRVVELR